MLDHVSVQHHRNVGTQAAPRYEPDGISVIGFKSYDQGRAKWQGATLDFVWFDENSNGLQDPGEAGIGGVATQALVNPYHGIDGIKLLREGKSPHEVVCVWRPCPPQAAMWGRRCAAGAGVLGFRCVLWGA